MEFNLEKFDPHEASQEAWDQFHKFRRIYHNYLRPNDPLQPDDIAQRNMLIQLKNPEFDFAFFGVKAKDNPNDLIGTFMYGWFKEESQMYKGNEHVSFSEMTILPEFRRKGIGSKIANIAYENINRAGKKVIISNTEEQDGREFAKTFGANEALSSVENRLQLAETDWDMMKEWVRVGEERNPTTKIKFLYDIPDDIIAHYADVYTETLKQVPLGELEIEMVQTPELIRKYEKERKDQEKTQLTAITVEEDGEISGLTELIYNPHLNVRLSQNLTSVREHHRGRGLGKWLKAAALLKAKEDWPTVEHVSTGNANSNAPMLAINNKMGFKVHKEIFSLQVGVDTLGEKLGASEITQQV